MDTFWNKFEPGFGRFFAFLFFGANGGRGPQTPRIFMGVCGGHYLVMREEGGGGNVFSGAFSLLDNGALSP